VRRIIFVDDEPNVLAGIQRMLRQQRGQWNMAFATGGDAALAEMSKQHFDVIVTDMRMPGMDGATLLKTVKERDPRVVRIILSGFSELEAVLRSVPVAHQFLTKPCDADILRDTIERACCLQTILSDEALRRLVGGVQGLPSIPHVYSKLVTALENPDASLRDVAAIVETDVGLCARILQLVNSSFFGLGRKISNLQSAVSYLGINTIKNLSLSVDVFRTLKEFPRRLCRRVEILQDHALLSSAIARRIVEDKPLADEVFVASLLHDVGQLVLITRIGERYAEIQDEAQKRHKPIYEIENEQYGTTHAEVGAYLLGIWGLPYPVVEAVAYHHHPGRVNSRKFDTVAAVHVADYLTHRWEGAQMADGYDPTLLLDRDLVASLGIADRLPEWEKLVDSMTERRDG